MWLIHLWAAIALAFLATVESVPFSKRAPFNAPGWDPRSTPFPPVRRGDVVFQYRSHEAKGNVSVPDPYNWFESGDAEEFINSQVAFTKTYVDKLEDVDAIRSAIKDVNLHPTITGASAFGPKHDPTYLYYFQEAGSKFWISHIAKQKDMDDAARTKYANLPGKVLIDDNLLGNKVSFRQQISPDGTKVLYSVGDVDTWDNVMLFVRDVSNPLIDKLQKVQEGGYGHYPDVITKLQGGSESWSGDSKSFFYSSPDGSVRYHVLGTTVKDDPVVVKPDTDKNFVWWTQLSDDNQYIILYGQGNSLGRRAYVASLDQNISGPIKWLPVAADDTFFTQYATNNGQDFYFRTAKGAPNHRIARFTLDFTKAIQTDDMKSLTQIAHDVTVVPENPDAKLSQFVTYDTDKIFTIFVRGNVAQYIAFNLKTGARLQELLLDTLSNSAWSDGFGYGKDVYLTVNALNTPVQFYHLKWNSATNTFTSELVYQQKSKVIDPDKYIVERQWVPSKTGNVKIPIFILHRKGLKLDGSHPVIIDFNGAYGYSYLSWFDANRYAFVRSYDAVYILAAPRGGGELGDSWHKSAQTNNKQNTFDDVLAVAQYAIDQRWTRPGQVILQVSYSGVMAAAAIINQAAEGMIGAYLATNGIFDLLRSDQSNDKEKRAAEYGSPSDSRAFDWLRKYSPLQNINPKKAYPTILVYPTVDDTSAEPWHSYKYISELQFELPNNPNPILLGNSTAEEDERVATAFALAAHTLGFKRV